MDAANVDLKGFTEDFYHSLTAAHLQPVLDTLRYLVHETQVWTEITTLLISGHSEIRRKRPSVVTMNRLRGCARTLIPDSAGAPAELTWTHVVRLLSVENDLARRFYVKQCALEGWSTRELDRQVSSMLFERLALSTDKDGVLALARRGHAPQRPEDLLKDPFVFEFLGLKTDHALSESELEGRLIGHLQDFLMELAVASASSPGRSASASGPTTSTSTSSSTIASSSASSSSTSRWSPSSPRTPGR